MAAMHGDTAPRGASGGRGAELPPFASVVERHGPAVLRFCVAQVGAQKAEDCFQETMLAALRAYGSVRDAEAVRAWLFSIAARKAIDGHRTDSRAPAPVADPARLAGAAPTERPDREIWARVGELPGKQREAVALRYLGDLSHGEIGKAMGISEAAARRNVFEGLRRLRQELSPAGPALPAEREAPRNLTSGRAGASD